MLRKSGALILILDTGAQANVMGPEFAHMLVRRRPPPADLRLFGAGDTKLVVIEMGTPIIKLAPSTNPRAGLGALSKRAIAGAGAVRVPSWHGDRPHPAW